jgi:catechol 2,3-dioxygenase-like lactoylglutathione lyase family enzyme
MNNSSSTDVPQFPPFVAQTVAASLTVADVATSRDWYRDVLGFTVDREHQREGKLIACSLKAGTIRLLVTQDDGSKGPRVKGEGFSLQFTTAQSIDAIAAHAKAAGATLDTEPMDMMGVRVFRLRDLDGFKLVFSSPRDW